MKMSCGVIRDLLLLYEDEGCSEESRQLVEEHLEECEECRKYWQRLRLPAEMAKEQLQQEISDEGKTIRKSFRKIRKRWLVSIISVLMIFPLAGIGVLISHECRGEGVCFTNLDDIWRASYFLKLIQDEKYEKAAGMITFEDEYANMMERLERGPGYEEEFAALTEYSLNGEAWLIKPGLASLFTQSSESESEASLWTYAIVNGAYGLMIPEEIWETLISEDIEGPGISREMQGSANVGELFFSGTQNFYLMETEWGKYYVNGVLGYAAEQGDPIDAALIYEEAYMLPADIFEEAKDEIIQEREEQFREYAEACAQEASMTQEEYNSAMQARLMERLRLYQKSGSSFDKVRLYMATKTEGHWQLDFMVTEHYADGSEANYRLIFKDYGGELKCIGGSFDGDSIFDDSEKWDGRTILYSIITNSPH